MKFTAKQIADLLKGTVEGNHDAEVNALSKIEEGKPGTLSFLSNPKYTPYIYDTKASVVIVNKGDKKAGFVVDSLIGQQEIVIKTLGKFLTNIKMIAGATILGDGEVALILDVNTLV